MTAKRKKKHIKMLGKHTHGWGSKKKHRGSGNKGGVGMAGTGKRADAKMPMIWKDLHYFGKYGFKKKNINVTINAINLRTLVEEVPRLIEQKLAQEKNGVVEVELEKLGYNKLLSNGRASRKLKITVPYASPKAIEKVKAAGGEVTGLAEKQKAVPKAE